jgi:hypothetical protein
MAKALPSWRLSRRQLLAAAPLIWARKSLGDGVLQVVHQGPESPGDTRNDYYWRLLDAALARTVGKWGPYRLDAGDFMNGPRAVHELQIGHLNIIARSTGPDLERQLLPIRIPLDRGLLGFRVFLIRRDTQAKLDQIQAWNDIPILEAAGFHVVQGNDYEGMFNMLAAGRFDLFSRSAVEAVTELQTRQHNFPDLQIERNLLLYYPLPRYLFVRRGALGEQLAKRVLAGFEAMLLDGSFNRLFEDYRIPIERSLGLKTRRLFRIPNPTLSPETPLGRTELWYDPTR